MKITTLDPPREYQCGFEFKRTISDCARLELQPDEQITFLTESGAEYDITRKDFGFYATPSTNGRLKRFGLRAVIVLNNQSKSYVFLVESGKESCFYKYLAEENMSIIRWLDTDESVLALTDMPPPSKPSADAV